MADLELSDITSAGEEEKEDEAAAVTEEEEEESDGPQQDDQKNRSGSEEESSYSEEEEEEEKREPKKRKQKRQSSDSEDQRKPKKREQKKRKRRQEKESSSDSEEEEEDQKKRKPAKRKHKKEEEEESSSDSEEEDQQKPAKRKHKKEESSSSEEEDQKKQKPKRKAKRKQKKEEESSSDSEEDQKQKKGKTKRKQKRRPSDNEDPKEKQPKKKREEQPKKKQQPKKTEPRKRRKQSDTEEEDQSKKRKKQSDTEEEEKKRNQPKKRKKQKEEEEEDEVDQSSRKEEQSKEMSDNSESNPDSDKEEEAEQHYVQQSEEVLPEVAPPHNDKEGAPPHNDVLIYQHEPPKVKGLNDFYIKRSTSLLSHGQRDTINRFLSDLLDPKKHAFFYHDYVFRNIPLVCLYCTDRICTQYVICQKCGKVQTGLLTKCSSSQCKIPEDIKCKHCHETGNLQGSLPFVNRDVVKISEFLMEQKLIPPIIEVGASANNKIHTINFTSKTPINRAYRTLDRLFKISGPVLLCGMHLLPALYRSKQSSHFIKMMCPYCNTIAKQKKSQLYKLFGGFTPYEVSEQIKEEPHHLEVMSTAPLHTPTATVSKVILNNYFTSVEDYTKLKVLTDDIQDMIDNNKKESDDTNCYEMKDDVVYIFHEKKEQRKKEERKKPLPKTGPKKEMWKRQKQMDIDNEKREAEKIAKQKATNESKAQAYLPKYTEIVKQIDDLKKQGASEFEITDLRTKMYNYRRWFLKTTGMKERLEAADASIKLNAAGPSRSTESRNRKTSESRRSAEKTTEQRPSEKKTEKPSEKSRPRAGETKRSTEQSERSEQKTEQRSEEPPRSEQSSSSSRNETEPQKKNTAASRSRKPSETKPRSRKPSETKRTEEENRQMKEARKQIKQAKIDQKNRDDQLAKMAKKQMELRTEMAEDEKVYSAQQKEKEEKRAEEIKLQLERSAQERKAKRDQEEKERKIETQLQSEQVVYSAQCTALTGQTEIINDLLNKLKAGGGSDSQMQLIHQLLNSSKQNQQYVPTPPQQYVQPYVPTPVTQPSRRQQQQDDHPPTPSAVSPPPPPPMISPLPPTPPPLPPKICCLSCKKRVRDCACSNDQNHVYDAFAACCRQNAKLCVCTEVDYIPFCVCGRCRQQINYFCVCQPPCPITDNHIGKSCCNKKGLHYCYCPPLTSFQYLLSDEAIQMLNMQEHQQQQMFDQQETAVATHMLEVANQAMANEITF